MIAKCECQQCAQPIEFEASELERSSETPYRVMGQFIACPHCSQQTQIYMPRHAIASAPANVEAKPKSLEAVFIFGALTLTMIGYILESSGVFGDSDFGLVAIAILSLPLYFVPSVVGRKKKNAHAIFMLNLMTGWTFIGWIASMVWACTKD